MQFSSAYLADSLWPTSKFVTSCHLRFADTTTLLVPPTRRVTLGDLTRTLSSACVERSASTDQGHFDAVVFSAADKEPSVSAVGRTTDF